MLDDAAWFDDQAESLSDVRARLHALGQKTHVSEASPLDKGTTTELDYKRFIVDNKFGNIDARDGERFAAQRLLEADNRVVVFSAFLESTKKTNPFDLRSETRSAVMHLQKSPVNVSDTEDYFERLSQCIYEFFNCEYSEITEIDIPTPDTNSDITALGYYDFERLPLGEKRKLYREFKEVCRNEIQRLFSEGVIWLLYAGSQSEPYRIAHRRSEILSSEEVGDICAKLDVIPFIFRRDVRVDNTGCADGNSAHSAGEAIAHYPVASLKFEHESSDRTEVFSFHFDTGADYCIFCEDFVETSEVSIQKSITFGELELHGVDHLADLVELDVLLVNPPGSRGQSRNFHQTLRALVIDDWLRSGLTVYCSGSCGNGIEGSLCAYRVHGILGRTLYVGPEDMYEIQISPVDSQVQFHQIAVSGREK